MYKSHTHDRLKVLSLSLIFTNSSKKQWECTYIFQILVCLRTESTQVMCQNNSGGLFSIPFLSSPSTKISAPLQWSSHSHYRKGARCWVSEKTGMDLYRLFAWQLSGLSMSTFTSSETQIPLLCQRLTKVPTSETCSPQATISSDINWYLSLCLYWYGEMDIFLHIYRTAMPKLPSHALISTWRQPGQPVQSYGIFQPCSYPR